ncbi:MAG: cupin domain-containing protein [Nanoarchaeota archaeon]
MKLFKANEDGWYCGYWNNSPIQIKHSSNRPLKNEPIHKHSFAEYYLVLKGKLTIQISSNPVEIKPLELVMIESGEPHKIIKKSSDCSYLIIKEKSFPENKELVQST